MDKRDLLAVLGIALVAYGLHSIYAPLAPLAVGCLILYAVAKWAN